MGRRFVSIGMLGVPNVGKSTLWNALTRTQAAEAKNFPFCTIEPNITTVGIPDKRLATLAKVTGSAKIIPTQLEIVDIAGLIAGAHEGKGLGNQFLGDVRQTSALVHVVRCFEDSGVIHVDNDGVKLDPIRDWEIIRQELLLADMQWVAKRAGSKKAKSDSRQAVSIADSILEKELPVTYKNVLACMEGNVAATVPIWEGVKQLGLLTSKPMVTVANVDEDSASVGNQYCDRLKEFVAEKGEGDVIVLSAVLEEAASMCEDEEAQNEFLGEFGLKETGLAKLLSECAVLLNLSSFYTLGPQEARAWSIPVDCPAVEAAGKIHSDIAQGFISADVCSPEDWIKHGGIEGAKKNGCIRQNGKDYVVGDGDIINFRFRNK